MSPALAGAKVDGDDAVAAFGRGIGHVGYAVAGGAGDVGAQVEAYVVDVAVWVDDVRGKHDGLESLVGCQVYTDELGTALQRIVSW